MLQIKTGTTDGKISFALDGTAKENIEEALILLSLLRETVKDEPEMEESLRDLVAAWARDPNSMAKALLGTSEIDLSPVD